MSQWGRRLLLLLLLLMMLVFMLLRERCDRDEAPERSVALAGWARVYRRQPAGRWRNRVAWCRHRWWQDLTFQSGSPFLLLRIKSPPVLYNLLPPPKIDVHIDYANNEESFAAIAREWSQPQLLKEEVGDFLAARFSSCRNSSHADACGDILFSLQPEEKAVRTIKGMGHAPNTDFKAAQGHLASAAGCVPTFHPIDTLIRFGYCITRGWGFVSRTY